MTGHLLGIDLGGTGTRIVLTDHDGGLLAETSLPTTTDPTTAVADLTKAINTVARQPLDAIGIGASGPVDSSGVIRNPATLAAYTGLDLVGELRERFQVPVTIDNDAVTAAYAETRIGAGRGVDAVLVITLGTGVGVAMLTNGQPLRTATGQHPEAGHLSVPGEAPCYCGRASCWEQTASRAALQTAAKRQGLDLAAAADQARAGHQPTLELFESYGAAVADGLADLLTLLGPDLVVLGGGGALFHDLYRTSLDRTLDHIIGCYKQPPVTTATCGNLAGAIGAALWATRNPT